MWIEDAEERARLDEARTTGRRKSRVEMVRGVVGVRRGEKTLNAVKIHAVVD